MTNASQDSVASIGWLILLIGIIFAVYRDTWFSMLDIWLSMDTFGHCLIVIPISAYLAWRKRDELKMVRKKPSGLGIIILFILSIVWWLSLALGLQIGMHAAVVAMLPALVLALYGMSVTRTLWFPLAFLIFAIPFGEFVIPTLVDVTASLTVKTVRALGIQAIREGEFFQVSSGAYSIAKACAGLSYTIAALAFATLVAKVYFKSWAKGALFICFAVFMSIIANSFRATAIVLIMHYSDLDIRAAEDHEFVGWLAYLLLVGLMLVIAAWLGDPHESRYRAVMRPNDCEPAGSGSSVRWPIWSVTLGCVIVIGSGALLSTISVAASGSTRSYWEMPQVAGWIYESGVNREVLPDYNGFTDSLGATYSHNAEIVYVSLISYRDANQDSEMINAANFVLPEKKWMISFPSTIKLDQATLPAALETVGQSRFGLDRMLVWYWYEVNGERSTSTLRTKAMEARRLLTLQAVESTVIIFTTPILKSREESQEVLGEFVGMFYRQLSACDSKDLSADCDSAQIRRDL